MIIKLKITGNSGYFLEHFSIVYFPGTVVINILIIFFGVLLLPYFKVSSLSFPCAPHLAKLRKPGPSLLWCW